MTLQESVAIAREHCRFTRERSGRWGGSSPRETGKTPTPPAQRRCPVTAVSTVSETATEQHGVKHLTRLSHSCKHQSTIQCRRTLALKMSESAIHLFINCMKVLVCCSVFRRRSVLLVILLLSARGLPPFRCGQCPRFTLFSLRLSLVQPTE